MNKFAVGKITRSHGLNGYVVIHPFTYTVERFRDLKKVHLGKSDEKTIPMIIEDVIINGRKIILKLNTVSNRSSSERIKGEYIFIEEGELFTIPQRTYYIHDIIGCKAYDETDSYLGIISEVIKLPAQDNWILQDGKSLYMIPAVKEFIKKVDICDKKVILHLIDGLIDK